mmetsp:Transcript_4246/g.10991  ORF Transcript_4246/g.10991 Transcript_4246/m.10991 type:complete len:523 (-) Transcript_4246:351-1919(-)
MRVEHQRTRHSRWELILTAMSVLARLCHCQSWRLNLKCKKLRSVVAAEVTLTQRPRPPRTLATFTPCQLIGMSVRPGMGAIMSPGCPGGANIGAMAETATNMGAAGAGAAGCAKSARTADGGATGCGVGAAGKGSSSSAAIETSEGVRDDSPGIVVRIVSAGRDSSSESSIASTEAGPAAGSAMRGSSHDEAVRRAPSAQSATSARRGGCGLYSTAVTRFSRQRAVVVILVVGTCAGAFTGLRRAGHADSSDMAMAPPASAPGVIPDDESPASDDDGAAVRSKRRWCRSTWHGGVGPARVGRRAGRRCTPCRACRCAGRAGGASHMRIRLAGTVEEYSGSAVALCPSALQPNGSIAPNAGSCASLGWTATWAAAPPSSSLSNSRPSSTSTTFTTEAGAVPRGTSISGCSSATQRTPFTSNRYLCSPARRWSVTKCELAPSATIGMRCVHSVNEPTTATDAPPPFHKNETATSRRSRVGLRRSRHGAGALRVAAASAAAAEPRASALGSGTSASLCGVAGWAA